MKQPCYDECPLSKYGDDGDRVVCELDIHHGGAHEATLMYHYWTNDRIVVTWTILVEGVR
jgi:hypothetical protein